MALFLKQSTAVDVLIGPFVDSTDGYTSEEGLSPAVELSKNGQALAAKNDATTPVVDDFGYYNCELDATDTNTVGTLVLAVEGSATALPVRHEFQVVEESVYDNFYAASAVGPLTAAQVNAEVDTGISDAALATATALATVDGNVDAILVDTGTTLPATLGTPAADVSADIAAVKAETALIVADTNELQTDDVPGLIAALNDVSTAEVNAEVDTALADINLDHFVGTATAIPAVPAGTYLDQMLDDGTATYDRTTDSLQAIADSGGGGPTAAQIADQVWEEVIGDHSGTSGSTAEALANASSAGDPWSTALPGAYGAGTAGNILGNNLDATISGVETKVDTVDGVVDTILVDTADMQPKLGTPAADVSADIAAVKAETALIVADTNELQGDWANGGRLDLILDARASQTTADAIETDTQDIQSRIPAALVSGKMDSDMTAISGDTTAADNLEEGATALAPFTVNDAGASTTAFIISSTEATDDHYNGRIITFTTGSLADQSTDITDYTGSTKTVTVTALTEAPGNGDAFVIS